MLAFFLRPSGRIGRAQWWLAQIAVIALVTVVLVVLGILHGDNEYGDGPDLNIGDDLKALRETSGQPSPVVTAATYRPAPTPRTSGPPVFGKRV